MSQRNVILVAVCIVVVIFLIGYALGTLKNSTPKASIASQNQSQVMPEAIKVLSSKVIPAIAAYGMITKIDGRNVTMTYQTDSIVVAFRTDAKIYSYTINPAVKTPKGAAPAYVTTLASFNDLKVGQNISANIKVDLNGQVEGFSAIFIPGSLTTPAK